MRQTKFTNAAVHYAPITAPVGTTAIAPAVTGNRIVVLNYVLSGAGAATAQWKSAATAVGGVITLAQGVPINIADPDNGVLQTEAGEALNLTMATAAGAGHIAYVYTTKAKGY